ncbi:hypothetical protein [Lacticaseibacillus paracasei]|uniref:hypothetical protein n=1 Tax=Lacticaseibacillus paracasei TaxID=1597 RepID=UPI003C30D437
MHTRCQEPNYVEVVNQNLERLLVFETVFKEYVHTCKNIEKGNCYASESVDHLRLYFTKNVMKFCTFVDSVDAEAAPCNYAAFHKVLVNGLRGIRGGVLNMLQAIGTDKVDHDRFAAGLAEQQAARAEIDTAFSKILDPIF